MKINTWCKIWGMLKSKDKALSIIGVAGTLTCLVIYFNNPSFPTPDKLVIFLVFVFMIFNQAKEMLKRLLPFVALLLVYESFRGVADQLNTRVNYLAAPDFDKAVFGRLPTASLQDWLWRGHTSWYDMALYIPYMLFFVVPLGVALLVWKTRSSHYWRVVATYLTVFFMAFLTFLIFPAAPPWMASQYHYIEPIVRVSSSVWFSLGIQDFPSVYNHIAPNPVAAVPSLHVAIPVLTSIFMFKLYGRRWGWLSLIYPFVIAFGVVYEGEHYVFDVLAGVLYAFAGYLITPRLIGVAKRLLKKGAPVVPKPL